MVQTNLANFLRAKSYSLQKEADGLNGNLFQLLLIISLSIRFFYFGELIDEPHSWRQCDTANYILDFYNNGINLLAPSVCWMGWYKTVLFEFPLPEALCSILYHLFGPYHIVARFFFFFFYIVGVYFFYKILLLYADRKIAQIASIIYTLLPLSLFYSRAIHIDFFALCFAFGMFYYYAVGIKNRSWKKMLIAGIYATICFLVKAPYAFSFLIPLLYIITKENAWKYCFQHFYYFLFPVCFFLFWIYKSNSINSLAPDWSFIPNYHRFNDNFNWYFGKFEHRFIARSWGTLLSRFLNDVMGGSIGCLLFFLGIAISFYRKVNLIFCLWLLGVLIYFFVFFNLNVIHNYYQIPFLPIVSFFMAVAIVGIISKINSFSQFLMPIILLGLAFQSIAFSKQEFFKIDDEQHIIGNYINKNTKSDELVLVSVDGLSVHCPNILYRARRNGWSVPTADISGEIVFRLTSYKVKTACCCIMLFKKLITGIRVENKNQKTRNAVVFDSRIQ